MINADDVAACVCTSRICGDRAYISVFFILYVWGWGGRFIVCIEFSMREFAADPGANFDYESQTGGSCITLITPLLRARRLIIPSAQERACRAVYRGVNGC